MQGPASYPYLPPPELQRGGVARTQVAIVGAGPVGLACAIDLAQHGIDLIIIDDNNALSTGTRAICWAKRTLEILDRLGCGDPVCERGVSWKVGKVFFRDQLAYQFDLLPEPGHKRPAFVNLQQNLVEEVMVDRLQALGHRVRWKNKAVAVEQDAKNVRLHVETPDGRYTIEAHYVIAADGVRSAMRHALGLDWKGQVFNDRFLIADVLMKGDFPAERWFHFEPSFHHGGSVLLHKQAGDIWRIDFQLGRTANPDEEKKPERVQPRIRAMLGDARPFELQWASVYTFQCARLEQFVHERVIFAGDAAHQVSPFGARGANSGIQDADNLCWKLARVVRGESPPSLLQSYERERQQAADENILHSTRSTDFITPKSPASRRLRDAVLALSATHEFARRLVNSGRLSTPTHYRDSPLSTPDCDRFDCEPAPGAPAVDAPVDARTSLLARCSGGFSLLTFDADSQAIVPRGVAPLRLDTTLREGSTLAARYDAQPGTSYLLRPDQHIAARWRRLRATDVQAALARAQGLE